MKKLLLLLLLTSSFSAFSLEIVRLVPCDGDPLHRQALIELEEENWVKRHITLEDQSLSNTEKAEQIKVIVERILEIDTYLSDLANNCKKSPEGSLINNLREGKWTWYDQYNRVIKQGNYVNGKKEGQWTEKIYTGHAFDLIEMNYKNNELDGKWTYWYYYEGPLSRFRKGEKVASFKRELKQAIEEGNQTTIKAIENILQSFEMPKIIAEGYYVKGKREGFWTEFGNGGGNYINGIKDGAWIESDSKGNYINGIKDGIWTYWYSFGEVYKEEIYEDGILIEKKFL
jgi:antitoxin component YwqK of YwqJK toxin-antitoxin module